MSNFDLNIDNYDLEDLLNLFHLNYEFDENDLKRAKTVALKTHPDKSGSHKEVFLFFMKAYKMIESIYEFKMKERSVLEIQVMKMKKWKVIKRLYY